MNTFYNLMQIKRFEQTGNPGKGLIIVRQQYGLSFKTIPDNLALFSPSMQPVQWTHSLSVISHWSKKETAIKVL